MTEERNKNADWSYRVRWKYGRRETVSRSGSVVGSGG